MQTRIALTFACIQDTTRGGIAPQDALWRVSRYRGYSSYSIAVSRYTAPSSGKGSEKAISRRCLERPLEEYAPLGAECTKIAHRRSLAIFTADEGIAGNSAARIIFTSFHRRKNRGSLAVFFAEEIAHLVASKSRAICPGAVKIAAATAENRAILVHSA